MPASAGIATPIRPYRVFGTGSAVVPIRRLPEATTQTFKQGVPLQISAGYVQECAAITSVATALIVGIGTEPGADLASAGVPETLTTGQAVPNQPNASIIPLGAPPNDGTTGFNSADAQTSFQGVLGNSNTGVAAVAQTDLGATYGLTKDATTGGWYVDKYKTTAATGACVTVVGLIDDVGTANGRVEFIINEAARQLMQ